MVLWGIRPKICSYDQWYPIDLYIHINRSILVRCIRRRNAHESGHWRVSDLVSSLWNRLIICSAQLPHGMKMESENLNFLHIIQHIGRSVVGCIRYIKGQLLLILEIYTICGLYRQLHIVGPTSTMNEGRRAKYSGQFVQDPTMVHLATTIRRNVIFIERLIPY